MKASLSCILITAVLLKGSINAADIADTNDIDLELRLGLPENRQTQLPAEGKANKQAIKREADRIRKKNFRKRMKESVSSDTIKGYNDKSCLSFLVLVNDRSQMSLQNIEKKNRIMLESLGQKENKILKHILHISKNKENIV